MNSLSVSLASDIHAAAPEGASDHDLRNANQIEVAIQLADVEEFTEWLSGECIHQNNAYSEWITARASVKSAKLREANVGEVVHLLLTGKDQDALLARDELKARYLAKVL